ncbi:Rne/Rng family ribonuclease [Salinibacterium sp. NSLL150]|uniref:Rne/Rng family ribonuclease n=1 Tax=unclassified Salinibacterium TaxID=2632331 RepID=UPI0018CF7D93|nr:MULTISPECIES: Rne/Rng family ribonuclease [unclassified Salinibacterium]MBH0098856.1 Rne/Rng family ribonuclease [Salinibacterium sp. NSLL35]MBH0101611.1 Rne/Rng family ribonuclease [Salinibacterium sp. NSLL150]MBH0104370.1 Rne/Rng family ribonuclease [Salinibacterium sp. NSLL16]MBH0107131.1 Rne/Rng family ribonuclease [Salinibacterium sp. NSLL17]
MVNESNNSKDVPKKKGLFGRILPSAKAPVEKPVAQKPPVDSPVSDAPVAASAPRAAKSSQRPAAKTASEHLGREVPDAVTGMKAETASEPTAANSEATAPAAAKAGVDADAKTGSSAPARSRSRKSPAAKTPAEKAKTEKATTAKAARLTPPSTTSLLFQAPDLPDLPELPARSSRSRNDNGAGSDNRSGDNRDGRDNRSKDDNEGQDEAGNVRRRSRRRSGEDARPGDESPNTVVRVRQPRKQAEPSNEPTRVKGSTRLEAKKQRRRDGRDAGRRRPVVTESEFLARRESVDRVMVVRSKFDRIQIGVLEDGVLVEHYVAKAQDASLIGNVYLGRVQNVLPSMEAAFVDIGRGRNAVLYSGEVDWDAAAENSADGKPQARRIELALKPGDRVLVQVTKDPVGHKGARLTSQVSLPGRYLVYVPNGSMSGISRKLPDTERSRLKKILKGVLPENVGVIVRTAAEGATEEQLTLDVNRLTNQWADISAQVENAQNQGPALLHSEPDLLIKIIRDVFNEDFHKLVIEGDDARKTIEGYVRSVAPDLLDRLQAHEGTVDSFEEYRISEQIEKALDRKVWLPSGGSLVIDRTEAMTVVDVNTGKFVGSGGNLEETVTKNNVEAAEEIVRQLRLRDIGGIIVVDFIDMVLESNRDLVLRRLVECLSRDRTKHQVAEVTSLGLVQMTRKKLGLGLLETFSENCEVCAGRGVVVHHDPVTKHRSQPTQNEQAGGGRRGRNRGGNNNSSGSNNNSGNSNGNNGGNNGNGGGSQTQQSNNSAKNTAPASAPSNGTHAITEDVRNALARVAASTVVPVVENQASETPAVDAAASAPAATETVAAPEPKKSRRSKGGNKSAQPAQRSSDAVEPAAEASVAIFDIPITKAESSTPKISTQDAEQILGSVLEALPEPKQPGHGKARGSRRASSQGKTVNATPTDDN